jgi:hypothetical protein
LPRHDRDALRVLRLDDHDLLELADDTLVKHRVGRSGGGEAAVDGPRVRLDAGSMPARRRSACIDHVDEETQSVMTGAPLVAACSRKGPARSGPRWLAPGRARVVS